MIVGGSILVTGATGQQGGAVARELLTAGHTVRAMTRNPESEAAKALAGLGAEIVQGDLNDEASLVRAVESAWGVFAVQNTWEAGVEGEEEQGKRLAGVAREHGVQHYVYTSVGSAQRETGIPHFDNKWRIEEALRDCGFPSYTILRPVFFMENWVSPWFKPYIDEGSLAIGIKPETKLQQIAVADIGKYGKLAFERHEKLNGQAIDIAGDELTGPETAEIVSKASGKSVSFFQVPIEQVREMSEDFALMLEWFDEVGYNADIEGNAKKYGIEPTSFEDWARHVAW
ncbi:MAG: NmrA family NAD(P)-binding protein [Gemmatimonadetes bacterium]|nr:NmrA family NAD(P)-binding protein [Gemmatimonadota bacterium]NIO30267.1 NmrA family NAD(P)-binding protein [Gemmatimonadota bacterium]